MRLKKADVSRICCACSAAQGVFDVRCYGAKGDGRANDHDAISAARDALNAAGGGVLFFSRGIYVVHDTIELGARTTVLGSGASSVLQAKADVACFNMLLLRNAEDVRVRDIVIDGNRSHTHPPDEADNENIGCGILGQQMGSGPSSLFIEKVIARDHHGSGIRITGPGNTDPDASNANEVEIVGCRVSGCASRGIIVTRATRVRIAGNVVTSCTVAGIQLLVSRAAVLDGNFVEAILQKPGTNSGHGIVASLSSDYVIVNNVSDSNERWGIVASGGLGHTPHPMSKRFVVANNVCRGNIAGGITIDPTLPPDDPAHEHPQDSFATVASNVCAANGGHGIHSTHAGYIAMHGNVCDANQGGGIAVNSSRYTVIADNVLTNNARYGVAFNAPSDASKVDIGHHLLGGNVYDGNRLGEIHIADGHPAIRQLQDRWPIGEAGGINLPVKTTPSDPTKTVEGMFYLNTADRKLQVYAAGVWRTLKATSGTSW